MEKCQNFVYMLPIWEKTIEDTEVNNEITSSRGNFINHFYYFNKKYPICTYQNIKQLAKLLIEKELVEYTWIEHPHLAHLISHSKETVEWGKTTFNYKGESKREISEVKSYSLFFQAQENKEKEITKFLRDTRYGSDYFCLLKFEDAECVDTVCNMYKA